MYCVNQDGTNAFREQNTDSDVRVGMLSFLKVIHNPWLQLTNGKFMIKKKINKKAAPKGMKWICCRYRKVRGKSGKQLDAHEYGYEAWCFLVPCAK